MSGTPSGAPETARPQGISETGKAVVQSCLTAGYDLRATSIISKEAAVEFDAVRGKAEAFIASLESQLGSARRDSELLEELERLVALGKLRAYACEVLILTADGKEILEVETLREAASLSLRDSEEPNNA